MLRRASVARALARAVAEPRGGRGWRRHVGPGGQRLRVLGRLGGGCWRLCWASSGAGLAAGAGLSKACKEGGELGRHGGELGQQKESLQAEIQEGREK